MRITRVMFSRRKLVAWAAGLATIGLGAVFVSLYQPATQSAADQLPASQPAATVTATPHQPVPAANPSQPKSSVSVTVNGQTVPVKTGTTQVPSGAATVNVSGQSVTVRAHSTAPGVSPATQPLTVSVDSHSTGTTSDGGQSYSSVSTSTTTDSSSTGGSSVQIQTNGY